MALREPTESAGLSPFARDGALDAALDGLFPARVPDRPDTPDHHVTAVVVCRRSPRNTRRFPKGSTRGSRSALGLARHLPALHASGRSHRPRARRPARRRHHADGVRQDALLQRARPQRDSAGPVEPRAVSLPDQGARAGSARRAAGDVRDARCGDRARRSACSPTTATRRRTRGARFGRAPTSCSATPTWCTRGSCRTIRGGRSCSRTSATS